MLTLSTCQPLSLDGSSCNQTGMAVGMSEQRRAKQVPDGPCSTD